MKLLKQQKGIIIVGAFIITFFFIVSSLAIAEFSVSHYSSARRTLIATSALQAAEAGADNFMYNINKDHNYKGTNNALPITTDSCDPSFTVTPITIADNTTQGKVTYESCVKNGSIANEKVVLATGKVYYPQTAAQPIVTRKVKLVLGAVIGNPYAVQTGAGGLTMSNTAVVGSGEVYLNGRLKMSNTAQIGTAATPATVHVANNACPRPANALYPLACLANQDGYIGATNQNDAICMTNRAKIWGNVHVNLQGTNCDIDASGTVSAGAATVPLPADNRPTLTPINYPVIKERVDNGDCPVGSPVTIWADHTHFKGDVEISHNCVVIVKGDIWIDGDLEMTQSAVLTVDPTLTDPNNPPTIAIDGAGGFKPQNQASMNANITGVGFRVITYHANGAACTPNCINLTGPGLATAQGFETITFRNGFTGVNSRFYARWSQVGVENATNVGSLIGQSVVLRNPGTVTFGFTVGGTISAWDVRHYEQVFK
ncbi:MAG TPA: hypothetical protein VNA68_03320 [Candidatus Dormibacteraeota bacterium]|nr:hypothetical protein [Candidatus Dormibacteraeota bacterium]